MALAEVAQETSRRTRVLIISPGPVSERLAGPSIRSWGFAEALSKHCDVTLLTPNGDHPQADDFLVRCHRSDPRLVEAVLNQHDVLVVQGYTLSRFPRLAASDKCIVVDVYDPFTLEALHVNAQRPIADRVRANRGDLNVLAHQLAMGDYFLCGHERQLDYWLGMLSACNRLNPQNSDQDPSFRSLIGIVPFSISPRPPEHRRQVLKGVHEGITSTDKVILWVGGIWDWFDPLTVIHAVAQLSRSRPDVKLVFLGVSSPDPSVPRMRMHQQAVSLSKQLGVHDRQVFFIDWVPHTDMENYLLEADIGTYMHMDHLEARYSIRTRIFDYIWAHLPMVISAGDWMGERAERAGLARTVPAGDVDSLAQALAETLQATDLRVQLRDRFVSMIGEFSAERATRPLVDYCRAPVRASDRLEPHGTEVADPAALGDLAPPWQLPYKTIKHLQQHGVRGLGGEIRISLHRRGWLR